MNLFLEDPNEGGGLINLTEPTFLEIPYEDPIKLFDLVAEEKWAIFLDSANHQHPFQETNRYSYIVFSPFKTFTLKNGVLLENNRPLKNVFDFLKQQLHPYKTKQIDALPPFQGGLSGYFAYDMCHYLEKVPYASHDDMDFPDFALGLYNTVISFDHKMKKSWIVATGFPELEENRQKQRAQFEIEKILELLKQPPNTAITTDMNFPSCEIRANFTKDSYIKSVEKVKNYILEGDVFEVNLSQRFRAEFSDKVHPYLLYKKQRIINPAPFAAYINLGDIKIASASPERFISLKNGHMETRPIKGTIPRGKTTAEDRQLAEKLINSEKDRSENVMIVDLMRNDLSRVSRDDSVKVETLCGLESYATVHHLVSVIKAELLEDKEALDLLEATIPGGSITGAPKVRAMEIISELEPNRRGPYCGNIAYISFCGNMDTSIAIRTYTINKNIVTFQAGGAVVLNSNPEEEYEETLHKANALKRALTEAV